MSSKQRSNFYHDLLAVALACVVSLLFAKGITNFVHHGGKKHQAKVSSRVYEDYDHGMAKGTTTLGSAIAVSVRIETSSSSIGQGQKLSRSVLFDCTKIWRHLRYTYRSPFQFKQIQLSEMEVTSIPIVFRKILI